MFMGNFKFVCICHSIGCKRVKHTWSPHGVLSIVSDGEFSRVPLSSVEGFTTEATDACLFTLSMKILTVGL
ncbi:hypothetical protein ARMSODRAFT_951306 [Armillaria solidipes]|uniref:Uncharacterized protein n=1 Tax=Armillaria solidipes TaxID=1076256 RepID=A0A2H3CGD8_9AGAR|nr:hypothetical protein ARMSODRAFT_951306 [Armillaria solidipes]